jgi:tRNA nucleotidyltransferase (CCA-adding enzyme)
LNLEWIPDAIISLMKRFDQAGYELVLVGGAVRSYYAGEVPKDWDLSTSATPEDMVDLSEEWGMRTIPTGIRHGTLTWIVAGYHLEITTYRVEGTYEGYRRPLEMTFTDNVYQDLARRDFTMNAMAVHAHMGLLDPFGGRQDLQRGVLRAVGDPKIRLAEDALRSFRAIRFASRYGMHVDPMLREALNTEGGKVRFLSGERVKQELDLILASDQWQAGVAGLLEFRLLKDWIPVWSHLHHDDILAGRWKLKTPVTRFAMLMLLADAEVEESDWDLVRLRASKEERKTIHQMLTHDPRVKRAFINDYEVRKLIRQLGKAWVEPYLKLYEVWHGHTEEGRVMLRVLREDPVLEIRDLAISGRDLIDLGLTSGPNVGRWLKACLDLVMKDPDKNTRDALLAYVKKEVG